MCCLRTHASWLGENSWNGMKCNVFTRPNECNCFFWCISLGKTNSDLVAGPTPSSTKLQARARARAAKEPGSSTTSCRRRCWWFLRDWSAWPIILYPSHGQIDLYGTRTLFDNWWQDIQYDQYVHICTYLIIGHYTPIPQEINEHHIPPRHHALSTDSDNLRYKVLVSSWEFHGSGEIESWTMLDVRPYT